MAAKRGSLSDFTATKASAAAPVQTPASAPPAAPAVEEEEPRKGQTIRLTVDAWRQLKLLAFEQARPMHSLILEALNDFFQKHGRPPLAR